MLYSTDGVLVPYEVIKEDSSPDELKELVKPPAISLADPKPVTSPVRGGGVTPPSSSPSQAPTQPTVGVAGGGVANSGTLSQGGVGIGRGLANLSRPGLLQQPPTSSLGFSVSSLTNQQTSINNPPALSNTISQTTGSITTPLSTPLSTPITQGPLAIPKFNLSTGSGVHSFPPPSYTAPSAPPVRPPSALPSHTLPPAVAHSLPPTYMYGSPRPLSQFPSSYIPSSTGGGIYRPPLVTSTPIAPNPPTTVPTSVPMSRPVVPTSVPMSRPVVPTSVPMSHPAVPTSVPMSRPLLPTSVPMSHPVIPTSVPLSRPVVPTSVPMSRPVIPTSVPLSRPVVPTSVPMSRPLLPTSAPPPVVTAGGMVTPSGKEVILFLCWYNVSHCSSSSSC